jgi:hypothetical protein
MIPTTRRDLLVGSASLPLAAAAARIPPAPLTTSELRILAMCATPAQTWTGREQQYRDTRIARDGTAEHRIVEDLADRGLVQMQPSAPGWGCRQHAVATAAGLAELRRAGV